MRAPLEWLKEFVVVRITPEALAKRLTMAGLEVVEIRDVDGEPVLEFEITPNRADCLSILGIAREVAALTGQPLKNSRLARGSGFRARGNSRRSKAQSPEPGASLSIRIEDRKGCSRYIGRLIEGLRVGPSPAWMQKRLLACGTRPITNLVDITNYVLFERGQPLHAFDYGRLAEGAIVVRRARPRERLTTLEGRALALDPETLVIADARQPVAVAGVMGGIGSEVTASTTTVLLESAWFDPVTVRRTARALGLSTESSYRFERGVDAGGVEAASARAAELFAALAGGTVRAVRDVGAQEPKRSTIVLEPARLNRWLGTQLSPPNLRAILATLSCRVATGGGETTLQVSPPSFRRDLMQAADLYEEVARVYGYDRIPSTLPTVPIERGRAGTASSYAQVQSLGRLCAELGLVETITWALVSEAQLRVCHMDSAGAIRLTNPLSQDQAYVRPALLIGLLHAIRCNLAQGAAGVRIFELGRVIVAGQPAREEERLGIALCGEWARDWQGAQACDFFLLKGLVEALVRRACGCPVVTEPATCAWAEEGQCGELVLEGRAIGHVGRIRQALLDGLEIEQPVWAAELSVSGILTCPTIDGAIRPAAQFPPVKRDLSIVVGQEISFQAVDRAVRDIAGPLASQVALIDRYLGKQIPAGKHSLTFSIEYRDPQRTLTAAEAEVLHQRISHSLTSRFGAQLR